MHLERDAVFLGEDINGATGLGQQVQIELQDHGTGGRNQFRNWPNSEKQNKTQARLLKLRQGLVWPRLHWADPEIWPFFLKGNRPELVFQEKGTQSLAWVRQKKLMTSPERAEEVHRGRYLVLL